MFQLKNRLCFISNNVWEFDSPSTVRVYRTMISWPSRMFVKGNSHFPTNFSPDRKGDMNVEELEELRKSVVRKQ